MTSKYNSYLPYQYGEHPADILIIAHGSTIEEAFKNAALGLINVIYDYTKVQPVKEKVIEVYGEDFEQLLFNWIDELLYIFDAEKFAIGNYFKEIIIKQENEHYKLRALVMGEKYDMNKHGFKGVIVKAMTYHMMEIKKVNDYWRLQFVVDI